MFEDDSDDDNLNDRDYIPSESEDGEERPSLLQLKEKAKASEISSQTSDGDGTPATIEAKNTNPKKE